MNDKEKKMELIISMLSAYRDLEYILGSINEKYFREDKDYQDMIIEDMEKEMQKPINVLVGTSYYINTDAKSYEQLVNKGTK